VGRGEGGTRKHSFPSPRPRFLELINGDQNLMQRNWGVDLSADHRPRTSWIGIRKREVENLPNAVPTRTSTIYSRLITLDNLPHKL
jgi:hypothetical protein